MLLLGRHRLDALHRPARLCLGPDQCEGGGGDARGAISQCASHSPLPPHPIRSTLPLPLPRRRPRRPPRPCRLHLLPSPVLRPSQPLVGWSLTPTTMRLPQAMASTLASAGKRGGVGVEAGKHPCVLSAAPAAVCASALPPTPACAPPCAQLLPAAPNARGWPAAWFGPTTPPAPGAGSSPGHVSARALNAWALLEGGTLPRTLMHNHVVPFVLPHHRHKNLQPHRLCVRQPRCEWRCGSLCA